MAWAALACASAAAAGEDPERAQDGAPGATVRIDLLDNGSFRDRNGDARDDRGRLPIPWWRSAHGMEQIVEEGDTAALSTTGSEWAEQPVAAYAPLASSIELRGAIEGRGRVTLIEGGGTRTSFEVGSEAPGRAAFRIDGAEWAQRLGRAPIPRFVLRLEAVDSGGVARWSDLSFDVELPCPSERELHQRVQRELDWIFTHWLERGRDQVGPRRTAFLCHDFDAVTGERLSNFDSAYLPLYGVLLQAVEKSDVAAWRAALEQFLDDFLSLGLDRETGLPCWWDPTADQAVPGRPMEIGLSLGFLIDAATQGPGRFRGPARAAAVRIGERVLAQGLLPDGNVAASYHPSDGAPNTNVSALRRFDVPLQLARLAKLTDDARYARAAREALATFEYTLAWAGTWDAIDPGFDDDFGHYGARAAAMALEWPRESAFARFAREGFDHYAPLWRDAVRLGGNVAADQVRCWVLAADIARLDPSARATVARLVHAAARSHFKGEQYENGSWGDVTMFRFDPKSQLQVGDFPGAPQNLLNGLASIYGADLGLRTPEIRAMYTAVLESSVQAYRRPYGYLLDRTERSGPNSARGSLRMLLGLVKMHTALAP